jgi:hypothetical protein
MILICRLYEHKGILWNFMFEHIQYFDSSYIHLYSCLYARLLDLHNLWVNDDIDRWLLGLSFFLTLFFLFFFLLRYLYASRDGNASDDDNNGLYLPFIHIVTAISNNFLGFFLLKMTHTLTCALTYKAYLSHTILSSREEEKKNSIHRCLYVS